MKEEEEAQQKDQQLANEVIAGKKAELDKITADIANVQSEYEKKKANLQAELNQVESELEDSTKRAFALRDKEIELNQREDFIKQKYQDAGVAY